jgi:hypothetical protein
MEGSKPIKVAGIEVLADEQTPLVDRLLRVIEEQAAVIRAMRDEIARLKGMPPRPTIRPSTLNAPHPDPAQHLECSPPRSGAQEEAAGQTARFGQTVEDRRIDDP